MEMRSKKMTPIIYYPKQNGARNTIHPLSQSERDRLVLEIERTGGMIVGRSYIADALNIADGGN
jgi:hypothetical protein